MAQSLVYRDYDVARQTPNEDSDAEDTINFHLTADERRTKYRQCGSYFIKGTLGRGSFGKVVGTFIIQPSFFSSPFPSVPVE